MILATIDMKVQPAMRRELLQTVSALVQPIRRTRGCLKCTACQNLEDEYNLCMFQLWQTQEDLDSYLRSDLFEVLRGTKNFMSKPWEIFFTTVSATSGYEGEKGGQQPTQST